MRILYRIYLYTILLFTLFFAAIAATFFLGTVLSATPLNGDQRHTLAQTDLVRASVLVVLAWATAAGLGGLHYWLIRRDQVNDPGAGAGAVRALFLNLAEGIAALTVLISGSIALSSIGQRFGGGMAGAYAAAVVFLALFAVLDLERRRTQAGPGAPIVLQRLHFYGMQLVALLGFVATFLTRALSQTVQVVLVNTGQLTCQPESFGGPTEPSICFVDRVGVVDSQVLVGAWAAAIFVTIAWIGYGLLTRDDLRSALRLVLHYAGFGVGVIFVLVALERGAELLLRALLGIEPSIADFAGRFEFVSPALVGAVIVSVYGLWLAREAGRGLMGAHDMGLTTLAVTAGILAAPFWVGCGLILSHALERVVPAGQQVGTEDWARALALIVTGLAYVPAALRLRQRSLALGIRAPRRGFGFVLLAGGIIASVIGLVFLLFTVTTAALGSPLDEWQRQARAAAVTLVIGLIVTGIYVQQARSERWLIAVPRPAVPEAATAPDDGHVAGTTTAAASQVITGVLDDLLAGRVSREVASKRLEELMASGR